ncbi:MAG: tRNA-dihydrouridine synthase family protein [Vicinamibacteria bacterium]
MAPLTRGGHLAFRRLCVELGAQVTVGEMVVARHLVKRGRASEFALLRSHPDEPCFGVQLADRHAETLVEAGRMAEARGARFVDLNCGCPIGAITGRGLGASLLKKPGRLARLVSSLVAAVGVPVTVKLRTGWSESQRNVRELARACEEAGASAISVHGRTREQRYSKAADWDLIGEVAAERRVPVVGNGDILTHYEAGARQRRSGVASLMIGRGALIKPWLFREIREGRALDPTPEERLDLLAHFVELMREHFGADDRGRKRILGFLPWHLGFFARYRPLPEQDWAARAAEHPLLQTRLPFGEDLPPLERLLRDGRPEVHEALAIALVDARTREEGAAKASELARALPPAAEGPEAEFSAHDVAG